MNATGSSAFRRPRVGGVAGGVGTSIIAALIGGDDLGVITAGQAVDVLVCRSVSSQLSMATRIAAAAPVAPVVVINADCPNRPPHQVRERARMLDPNVAALLWLAWIEPARCMGDPPADLRAAALATEPAPWSQPVRQLRHDLIRAVSDLVTSNPVTSDPEVTDSEMSSPAGEERPALRRTS